MGFVINLFCILFLLHQNITYKSNVLFDTNIYEKQLSKRRIELLNNLHHSSRLLLQL